jgi:hypothetical protein
MTNMVLQFFSEIQLQNRIVILRIIGVLDCVHCLVLWKLWNRTYPKLGLFPSSGEGETATLLGPLERFNQFQ